MHKTLSKALMIVTAVLALSPSAWAQGADPFAPTTTTEPQPTVSDAPSSNSGATLGAGTWGIGVIGTISGMRGAEFEYHLSRVLISAVAGFGFFSPDMGDSGSIFSLGGGAFYGLGGWQNVGFFLGGRAILSFVDFADSGVNFHIEAPIRAQYYINNHLAIHLEVGASITIIGDGGDIFGRGKGTDFSLGRTNLLNTAGATVYF